MAKRVYGKACGFCAKRKIKCNGASPCDSCEKRGRASSCAVQHPSKDNSAIALDGGSCRRSTDVGSQTRASTSDDPTNDAPQQIDATAVDAAPEHQQSELGANSMPSFISSAAHSSQTIHLQDMRPALGLQNASRQYPFMAAGNGSQEEQGRLPFSHAQALKYSQVYESILSPTFPSVPRYEDLEALVLTCLERAASCEAGMNIATDAPPCPIDHGSTSLMCAMLACGAQMSDDSPNQRVETSRALAQHAFEYARLANFLLRPKPSTLQAMLLLSSFLQNDGQADAAWALLGTVSRLAISLGLRKVSPASTGTIEDENHNLIWTIIQCQDCVLSMCFDRAVTQYSNLTELRWSTDTAGPFETYADCMTGLVRLSSQWLAESELSRNSAETICRYIDCLDLLDTDDDETARIHSLRRSRRGIIERMILQLRAGYFRGVMCTALSTAYRCSGTHLADKILRSVVSATRKTMLAFIELSKLTKLPLRIWSMIHAGLSSAIMVEFIGIESERTKLRQTQQAFLALLSREYRDEASDVASDRPAWLSISHSNYLRALQDLLRERETRGVGTGQDSNVDFRSTGLQGGTEGEMYAHADGNVTSISNGEGGVVEPENFDWGLMTNLDDPFLGYDLEIPPLCF